MRVTLLGCGGSGGVPLIGGDWGACDPAEPRNRRRRTSILVETAGRRLLVDTSPDLREQLLAAEVDRLDAVLWTHGHADHLYGLDDLRAINRLMGQAIPVFGPPETIEQVRTAFGYVFQPLHPSATVYYKPVLTPTEVEPGQDFDAAGVSVLAFEQDHGFSRTYGYRIGKFAYSTDVVCLNEAAFEALAGVETWVVDAYRLDPHPTHSHLARTLEWIARAKPRRAILTHMTEDMDYRSLLAGLPPGVEPGYDGMVIEC